MPTVNVRLYTSLKEKAGTDRMQVQGDNVAQALARVAESLDAETRATLFAKDGRVLSRFTLCLNTTLLDPRKVDGVPAAEGDVLHIMPPITGG